MTDLKRVTYAQRIPTDRSPRMTRVIFKQEDTLEGGSRSVPSRCSPTPRRWPQTTPTP
jgi:hypothetical protein